MTDKDRALIDKAKKTNIADFLVVHNMMDQADTEECRAELKKIRNLMFDEYQR